VAERLMGASLPSIPQRCSDTSASAASSLKQSISPNCTFSRPSSMSPNEGLDTSQPSTTTLIRSLALLGSRSRRWRPSPKILVRS
jgi:hypothetical protein